METIIRRAIEGGYKPSEMYLEETAYGADYQFHAISTDPLFWRALGKACGWKTGMVVRYYKDRVGGVDEDIDLESETELTNAEYCALRFHEINLTENWEKAVVYLQTVTDEK